MDELENNKGQDREKEREKERVKQEKTDGDKGKKDRRWKQKDTKARK